MDNSDNQERATARSTATQQASASLQYSANSSDRDSDCEGGSDEEGSQQSNDNRTTSLLSSDQLRELAEDDRVAQLLIKQKNREHAKNTRARRKNYIESLKEDIQQIISTRESRETGRKDALNKMAAQIAHRKNVLSAWFAYRTNLETDPVKWLSILDEEFEFLLPITPYRSFPPQEVEDGRRKVVGVDAVIFDTISLHAMAQSAVLPHSATAMPKVRLTYEVSEESIVAEDTLMCKWSISTENIAARGGLFDVTKQGMLLAVFTAESKLRSLEVSFDVMAFMQQLRRAANRAVFQVVPNICYVAPSPPAPPIAAALESGSHAPPSPTSSRGSVRSRASGNLTATSSVTANSARRSSVTGVTSGGRGDAFGSFMFAAEPRVVVSASEPFNLLLANKKYQEVFQPSNRGAAAHPVLEALFHSGSSDPQELRGVINSLRNMYPCCAVLSCSVGAGEPSPRVCPFMCTFLPLFGNDGTVEQFLVILEAITTDEAGASGGATGQTATRKSTHPEESGGGSGDSRSSHAGTTNGSSRTGTGSGSGVTDRESSNSAQEPRADTATRSADASAGAAGTSRKASRLTSRALDTQQAEDDRRAVSMQGAATQRWMDDVTASGPAHDFTQTERTSGGKMLREDRSSPQEMVAKSSRNGKHEVPVTESYRPCSNSSLASDGFVSGTLTTSGAGSGDSADSGDGGEGGEEANCGGSSDSAMLMSPAASDRDSGTPPSVDTLAVEALMDSTPSPPAISSPSDEMLSPSDELLTMTSTAGTTAEWAEGSVLPPENDS